MNGKIFILLRNSEYVLAHTTLKGAYRYLLDSIFRGDLAMVKSYVQISRIIKKKECYSIYSRQGCEWTIRKIKLISVVKKKEEE